MSQQNILELLKSSESEDIREGAYLAGKERVEDAIPLLISHIQSPDIGVQEAVDRSLRKIGGPQVVAAAIPLLRLEDAAARNIGMDLLREVGATDIDSLFQLLQDSDPDIRIFASDILGSSGSVVAVGPLRDALLHDSEVNVRYQAAVSLGNLAFPEAAESLNSALEDEEWVQFSVIEALIKIRAESSVGALVKALDTSSELISSIIVDALGEMGNIKAVPLLFSRLASTTGPLRNKIVASIVKILGKRSIGLIGAKERESLYEYMLTAIKDDDEDIQDAVVDGLAGMGGAKASSAIAELAVTLDPEREHERLEFMVESLAAIGFSPAIADMIENGSEIAELIGVAVISRAPSREGVELLKKVFPDKPRDLQRSIMLELATLCGPEDQEFFLDALKNYEDGNIIKSALMFLGRKGSSAEVGPIVTAFLEHQYDDVKEAALDACIALQDPQTIGYMLGMANDEEPIRRMMAVYALGAIDIKAYESIVLNAVNDPVLEVRRVALESLGAKCPLSPENEKIIYARLDDPESEIRLTVISVLGNCNAASFEECLRRGLDDPDTWVRVRCIESIGERRFSAATPKLVSMLEDENELIVIKTIEALGAIGGETAFRSLYAHINHDNPDIQRAAEEAAERLRVDEGA